MRWWLSITKLLTRRAAESIAFSVSDCNALWSRAEELVQAVVKYSTFNVFGRDWIEVASELPRHLPQECQERYRLADTVAHLTFVLLRISVSRVPYTLAPSLQRVFSVYLTVE